MRPYAIENKDVCEVVVVDVDGNPAGVANCELLFFEPQLFGKLFCLLGPFAALAVAPQGLI